MPGGTKQSSQRSSSGSPRSGSQVLAIRRRLSLSDVGPSESDSNPSPGALETRSMLMQLTEAEVIEFVGRDRQGLPRRPSTISVSSETDSALNEVKSFKQKSVVMKGAALDSTTSLPQSLGIGYACKKGMKPESPNQDSFFILIVAEEYSIYGVFDGHGRKGHDVSNFVKDKLPKVLLSDTKLLQEDPLKALADAFQWTQRLIEEATGSKRLDAVRSGSTATVVIHDKKRQALHVAHVGDSRCVLGRCNNGSDGESKRWKSVDLTQDHKPDLPEERARIEKAGGHIRFDGGWNHRVYVKGKRYPGLNMSRAMGDLIGFYDAGISATPDTMWMSLQDAPEKEECPSKDTASETSIPSCQSYGLGSHDKVLLICSDGVWEFISSADAVDMVGEYDRTEAMDAAEQLASRSWDQWISHLDGEVVDDITALVIHLDREPEAMPVENVQ